ncbi:4-phosphoerythronate dehydrogenase [Gallaecimonas xiamenensis]|uniref:Erythronate-4-phosphate dehydrogenase n=1 Tax=Gallaecimonas xiamenensis 3-C-1 TaxID=745411 RepID=K2J056_9GAMM|nr:4-phosphoerythronate dehydrogenase [Gallaecimonas xiamenensis]EKE76236.1 erythronate-4-phosphate dehydrogenase [Gallaecimonas xiamenensis 3-C-1]
MLNILADGLMPLVDDLFAPLGTLQRFEGRQPTPAQLAQAEVLLVRSVTQVDAALLTQAPKLRFIGSATIGTDHLDIKAIEEKGLFWTAAPGCNADAVADYVLSAVLNWQTMTGRDLPALTVGIVGVGNIGSRLSRRLNVLGVKVLCCDPPKGEPGFITLAQMLPQVDVLTLHVPGGQGTRHMIGATELAAMKPGALLINSCRGSVVDNAALLAWLEAGAGQAVLDVFATEPDFDRRLLDLGLWLTPHIAGHSIEGKRRGTWMLYEALCQKLGQVPQGRFEDQLPRAPVESISGIELAVRRLGNLVFDIRDDDAWFRAGLKAGRTFDELRRSYPKRREWGSLKAGSLEDGARLWDLASH